MEDVSPGAALAGFVTLLGLALRAVIAIIESRNARKLKRLETSIPPSKPAPPSTPSDMHRRIARLEQHDAMRVRVAILEAELADAREVAQDYARTAAALAHERAENDRLTRLVRELEERESRVTVPPAIPELLVDDIEIDESPTPRPQRLPQRKERT